MRRRVKEAYLRFMHYRLKRPRFEVREGDCFVASWPRSGNTWLRYLLSYALYPEQEWDLPRIEERMPTISRRDLGEALGRLEEGRKRIFKSHDPFCPYVLKGRTVYLVRDGRDAIASLYKYRSQLKKNQPAFGEFVKRVLRGQYAFGSWQEHVMGWMKAAENPAVLVLWYEEMVKDTEGQLRRVLEHFGLATDEARIRAAVERSSLDNVNKGFQKYAARRDRMFGGGLGGGSGRWEKLFGPEELELFMKYAGETMRRLGYLEGQEVVGCAAGLEGQMQEAHFGKGG